MRRGLAVAIGVAMMLPGVVSARPRVALVAFEGDNRGDIQDVVAEMLEGDYTITGPKQVSRTLDKLGFDVEMTEKELKKLANELEADAIVRGDLSQSGKRKLLHVRLFVNGKKVRGFKVEFASSKSEKFKQALKDKMSERLAGGEPAKKKKVEEEVAPASDEEDPLGGKAKKGAKVVEAEKGKKGKKGEEEIEKPADKAKKGKKGEAEVEATADEGKTEAELPPGDAEADAPKKRTARADDTRDVDAELSAGADVEPKSTRGPNVPAVRLDVGPSFSSRTLEFNSRNFEEAPKPFANALVPGARVSGELYPLAFGNPYKLIAGIGVAGEYDQTLSLSLESTVQRGTKFPVSQKHWSVGGRIRIAFGSRPTSPTVTLGGGYFHRVYKVDRSGLMEGNALDLPDVFYRGFNPGLDVRIPFVKALALVFGGQGLLVTSAGQIQQPYSYGRAKITAASVMAGFDIMFGKFFGLRLVGEATQFGYAFVGVGEQSNARDHDPTNLDVGGALDRYLGFSGTMTVLY